MITFLKKLKEAETFSENTLILVTKQVTKSWSVIGLLKSRDKFTEVISIIFIF